MGYRENEELIDTGYNSRKFVTNNRSRLSIMNKRG
jgi:hypothetical protein